MCNIARAYPFFFILIKTDIFELVCRNTLPISPSSFDHNKLYRPVQKSFFTNINYFISNWNSSLPEFYNCYFLEFSLWSCNGFSGPFYNHRIVYPFIIKLIKTDVFEFVCRNTLPISPSSFNHNNISSSSEVLLHKHKEFHLYSKAFPSPNFIADIFLKFSLWSRKGFPCPFCNHRKVFPQ